MVKDPEGPAIWVVTVGTFGTQSGLVCVVGQVTIDAAFACWMEHGVQVTAFARHQDMKPDQGKVRQVVVKGDILAPALGPVAAGAVGSQFPVMGIIGGVAAHAVERQIGGFDRAGVAGVARNLFMLARQGEPGVDVVVETHLGPGGHGVAGFALGAKTVGVHVLDTVAADAGIGQVRVDFVLMTGGTSHVCMPAQQDKTGCGMVKVPDLCPCVCGMAIRAFGAQFAPVRFVLAMAADAGLGGIPERHGRQVTAVAARHGMGADQCKIGIVVVKDLTVQIDDGKVPAFVVGVAMAAFLRLRFGCPAMVAFVRCDVGGNGLVTVKAKRILGPLRKRGMAIGAFGFQLCMGF